MEVVRVLVLPVLSLRFQGLAEIFGLEFDSPDQVRVADLIDFFFEVSELLQLIFVVLESGVLLGELSDGVLDVAQPEPFELLESGQEFVDLVLGSLDGTSQQKNDFHDFLVLGNHFVETSLLVVVGFGLLPIEEFLGASKYCSCGLIDGSLDFFLRRVQLDFHQVQLEVNFEERFGD